MDGPVSPAIKNHDPRASILKGHADRVLQLVGVEHDPLLAVARVLEQLALKDPFFVQRKLFPNVDFYSGIIYKALGFPTDMFPVLFALPRTAGWLAHWKESLDDKDRNITRPRQLYVGPEPREWVPLGERETTHSPTELDSYTTLHDRRRQLSVMNSKSICVLNSKL